MFLDKTQAPQLHIVQGRHPVLDVALDSTVVPNDTHLTPEGPRALVITGPNMGGKSCYMRQAALIAIMAQVQCPLYDVVLQLALAVCWNLNMSVAPMIVHCLHLGLQSLTALWCKRHIRQNVYGVTQTTAGKLELPPYADYLCCWHAITVELQHTAS